MIGGVSALVVHGTVTETRVLGVMEWLLLEPFWYGEAVPNLGRAGYVLKTYVIQNKGLVLVQDWMFFVGLSILQVCMPVELRKEVYKFAHNTIVVTHFRVNKS